MTCAAEAFNTSAMNDFEREVGEAFGEVCEKGMPILCKITNDEFNAVVQSTGSLVHLREPGYESEDTIIVTAPRSKFARSPEEYVRQILEVLEGPQAGVWVIQAVNPDVANYVFTCKPSE